MSDVAIRCDRVSVSFGAGAAAVRALDDVSIEVRRGATFAVVGESGSGKSTLGRVLLGLVRRDGGDVSVLGRAVPRDSRAYPRELRAHIQPVFQDPGGALDPRETVADALDEPLRLHTALDAAARAARARELLEAVGLPPSCAARFPHAISGGQKQRVAIARALATDAKVLVLDEPLSALDVTTQARVLALLADLRARRGLTYVFITHDLGLVRSFATDVAVLRRGRLVEAGPVPVVFREPRSPYTRALLDAVLSLDPAESRASLDSVPPGE